MTKLDSDEVPFSTSVIDSDVDPGAYRVAAVYAQALFAAAEKQGVTDEVLAQLDSLVVDVLEKIPAVPKMLASGMIGADAKVAMFDRVFKGRMHPVLLDFMKVLARHERGGFLRAIRRAMHDLYDASRGRVRVRVTTATPLDKESSQKIAAQLRSALKAEPILDARVDPEVIGGVIFRVGDTVYDGSVSAQLEAVRRQMITRSVHEIQSRRDRFSLTAGN
ncbi:MAG TPA: ATP synthase F1 subunit delta [Pirellulales bacterium]|nr:ATP synthase F1 subunit delta [Pirellulales bacterium]